MNAFVSDNRRNCARFDNSFRYFTEAENPVFVSALGTKLYSEDGKTFTDLNNGWSTTNFGHCHPELVSALLSQAQRLDHTPNRLTDKKLLLCQRLSDKSGIDDAIVFVGSTGSEIVELAKKLAFAHTGRSLLATFRRGFHGRTLGALSTYDADALLAFGIKVSKDYADFDYPDCSNCPLKKSVETCNVECLDGLEEQASENPNLAAVMFEPALGSGGYVFPPLKAMKRLEALAKKFRLLIIVDEIQMGLGRTGNFFLHKAYGISADIILVGKALAGGLVPISAAIGRPDVMSALPPGTHTGSFAGSPIACAVGLKVLELLENQQLLSQVIELGELFRDTLRDITQCDWISIGVQGTGLATGLEFSELETRAPSMKVKESLRMELFHRGVFALGSGKYNNRLCLIPSLLINREELLGHVLTEFASALNAVKETKN